MDVQPTPENGKGVGVENAVDQGTAGKGEAKAQNPEAVPEKPVESEGNGPTKDELRQQAHDAMKEAQAALKRGDKKAGQAALERAQDLQKQVVDFDKNAKAKAKAENPNKPKKTKFASVGLHPAGHPDILNTIEENGGVQTKSGAGEDAGGEHDDLASSFTGRAKMLLRKNGMTPDSMAHEVYDAGHTTEPTVKAMNAAVSAAVADRVKSAADMGKKALHDRFDRAFIGNEHPRKWLRAGKPVNVDQLNVGDKFNVDGEEFHVKGVNEDTGAVTIKDGITKEVPAGTWVHPDKGIVTKGEGDAAAGFEAQPKPDTGIKDVAKSLADKVRKLKGPKGGLRMDITGGIWDASIEMAAQTIEKGGTVAQAIANAIKRMRAMKPDATEEHDKAIEDHIRNAVGEPSPTEPPTKPSAAPATAKANDATSISNAADKEAREKYNLPDASEHVVKSDKELTAEAQKAVAEDPQAVDKILAKLKANPKAQLPDYGHVMLAAHKQGMEEDLEKAAKNLYDAQDRGDKSAEDDSLAIYKMGESKLIDFLNTIRDSKSEAGRALRALGLDVRKDYSIAAVSSRLRMANLGKEVPPEVLKQAHEEAENLKKLNDDLAKERDTERSARQLAEWDNGILRAEKQVADERAGKKEGKVKAPQGYFAEAAKAAKERLRQRGLRVNDITSVISESPGYLKDIGIIVADYIERGARTIGQFAEQWRKENGHASEDEIKTIWAEGQRQHSGGMIDADGRDHASETQATLDGLKDALKDAEEGQKPKGIYRYARAIQLQKIRSGIHGREAVVDAVHEELKKVLPDMTREQAGDAMSGYGNYKPLDMEPAKVEARAMNGELQQMGKIRTMLKEKRLPDKSGVQQREPTDEERRLKARAEEIKRQGNFIAQNPEKQLKSALQGIQTRLRNGMADMRFDIATGKRNVKTRTPVERDAATLQLEKDHAELRDKYNEIFKKPELTDEQRLRMAVKLTESQISKIQGQMTSGFYFDKQTRQPVSSPELKAAQSRLAALKAERDYARMTLQPKPDAKTGEEIALQARETRLTKRLALIDDKLARGDVSKPVKGEAPTNPRIDQLQAKVNASQLKLDQMARKVELKNREGWAKVSDEISKGAHFAALTGYHTLGKLLSYSAGKTMEVPVHEAVATVYSKIPGFRELYKKADIEGASSAKAIGKFITGMAVKGPKAMIEQLRTGTTEAKLLYGNKDIDPWHYSQIPGNIHAAEKAPLLTGVQEMYKQKMQDKAHAEGRDPNDPDELKRVHEEAQASILQEDNQAAQMANHFLAVMKKPDKHGHVSAAKTVASDAISTFLTKGILRMPMNYVMQALARTPAAGAYGLARLASANRRGISTLSVHDANSIARLITRGAGYGAAVFAYGLYDGLQPPRQEAFRWVLPGGRQA